MTSSDNPRFDLLRAIFNLLFVFISMGLIMYGMKTGKSEIITLVAIFSAVKIFLGKK